MWLVPDGVRKQGTVKVKQSHGVQSTRGHPSLGRGHFPMAGIGGGELRADFLCGAFVS